MDGRHFDDQRIEAIKTHQYLKGITLPGASQGFLANNFASWKTFIWGNPRKPWLAVNQGRLFIDLGDKLLYVMKHPTSWDARDGHCILEGLLVNKTSWINNFLITSKFTSELFDFQKVVVDIIRGTHTDFGRCGWRKTPPKCPNCTWNIQRASWSQKSFENIVLYQLSQIQKLQKCGHTATETMAGCKERFSQKCIDEWRSDDRGLDPDQPTRLMYKCPGCRKEICYRCFEAAVEARRSNSPEDPRCLPPLVTPVIAPPEGKQEKQHIDLSLLNLRPY